MDILNIIKDYNEKIDIRLRRFLKERVLKVVSISTSSREMMEHIMEFNLRGGKRIRPILVVFGYKAFGGRNENAIIDAAIAVELMQSFLLVHDDIIDQDELRRGYLTMHKIYENKCRRCYKGDAVKYGENMALIAGDILSILGSEAILCSDFPTKCKIRAIEVFNKAVINTCFGQALDITTSLEKHVTEKDIHRLYELKTAIYTFGAPLQIGALLAGAKERELEVLSRYAILLGKAFQLQDDLLGLFGTKKKIGKPVGSDIREGKKTLLIVKTMELADDKERAFIHGCLGKKELPDKDLSRLKHIVKHTGALQYTKDLAEQQKEQSKRLIERSRLARSGREFMLGLADYVVEREY